MFTNALWNSDTIGGQNKKSPRLTLERKLFIGKKTPDALDELFDLLSKAWQEVRNVETTTIKLTKIGNVSKVDASYGDIP